MGRRFICAAPIEYADRLFHTVRRSWQVAGRAGQPRLVAQANAVLGSTATVDAARQALCRYYGSGEYTEQAGARMLTTLQAVRQAIARFGEIGADEVMLYCWSADPDQVDRLAEAVS